MRTLRTISRRNFSSGGGGRKPPRRPFNEPTKAHYIDHVDFSELNKLLREMKKRAQNSGTNPFICHQMKKEYYVYKHHLNKGGGDSIMNEGGLRASEASGIAGGAFAARATGVPDPDLVTVPERDTVYFISDEEPQQTGNGGGMSGIGWRMPFLPFSWAVLVQPKEGTMKEFNDKTSSK